MQYMRGGNEEETSGPKKKSRSLEALRPRVPQKGRGAHRVNEKKDEEGKKSKVLGKGDQFSEKKGLAKG